MLKNKYLIRLDDACPTMNKKKWQRIFDILDRYKVRPMVGIIPHNEDPKQMVEPIDPLFWDLARGWERKGYAIALHGYNHCYDSNQGLRGLNPLWTRSEFSGLPYEEQCRKIEHGYRILCEHRLNPKYFFAPSHTFDENTLKALKDTTNIRIISDTIATKPYRMENLIFVPQVGGHCIEMRIPGIWTFCLHPNEMMEDNFAELEKFLESHHQEFVSFDSLDLEHLKGKGLIGRLLSWIYFTKRRISGIK